MTHTLMDLPFDDAALEPIISKETLSYHHGKHHAAYINNLNKLIVGTKYEERTLTDIVTSSEGGIFNNAAQVYNHNFYFSGMCSESTKPSDKLDALLTRDFGSFDAFKDAFVKAASTLFASGWVWLSLSKDGTLQIESFSNAGNPLLTGNKPLMTCDVWEHAYYIDYRNVRPDYIEKWWGLINWDFVSKNLEAAL